MSPFYRWQSPSWIGLRTLAIRLLAAYGLALALVLHSPLTNWLIRPLVIRPQLEASDAIVLLTDWSAPGGILPEAGLRRTVEAARLYRNKLAPVILISGRSDAGAGHSAMVMADFLVEMGVPRPALQVEERSRNTHESAVNVARLARARGWSRLLLVTDAKHMRRAVGAFRREGLSVAPAPTMIWELFWAPPDLRLRRFQATLHEYVGLAYYWWNGWI